MDWLAFWPHIYSNSVVLGIGNDPPPSPWESLGQELSELEPGHHQRELQESVKLIGGELSGEGSERSGG